MTTQRDPEGQVRPFADFLREQAQGKTHAELSANLAELVERVKLTRKTGTLTLTIKVEPLKGGDDALIVSDELRIKLPEFNRPASIFYSDDQGNLLRNNPNQPEFEGLAEVPAPPTPADVIRYGSGVSHIDPATGEITGIKITKEAN